MDRLIFGGKILSARNRVLLAYAVATLAVAASGATSAKDLGMIYGQPTPAFAMYAAQYEFSNNVCADAVGREQTRTVNRFVRFFNSVGWFEKYRKKDDDFAAAVDLFKERYGQAWQKSSSDEQTEFCNRYVADALALQSMGMRQKSYLHFFRQHLSPMSDASRRRQGILVGTLSVVGTAASMAGNIDAARDSVAAAKAGDWDTSFELADTSRNLGEVGVHIARLGELGEPGSYQGQFTAVFDHPDGTVSRCPVTDHFSKHNALEDDSIWITYQPIAVMCRDPAKTPPIAPDRQYIRSDH